MLISYEISSSSATVEFAPILASSVLAVGSSSALIFAIITATPPIDAVVRAIRSIVETTELTALLDLFPINA